METEHPLREYCVYNKKNTGIKGSETKAPLLRIDLSFIYQAFHVVPAGRIWCYIKGITIDISRLQLLAWFGFFWFFFLQGEVSLAMLFNLAQSSSRQVIITLSLLEKTKRQTS